MFSSKATHTTKSMAAYMPKGSVLSWPAAPPGGTYDDREIDLSKLQHFTIEDAGGKQWPMKVWFKPEMFYAIFGERNCAKCYKGGRICQCNLVQSKKESGKKRAAEREQAYAKRKAKVATTNFDF